MQVVILAGGLGSRLYPLTRNTPKPLITVNNKPFLHYQLNWLRKYGFRDVVLCVGYLAEKIERYLGNGEKYDIEITYSREKGELLGTAGAIKNAASVLQEEFCVINGDTFLTIDPGNAIKHYQKSEISATMVVYRNRNNYYINNVEINDRLVIGYRREGDTKRFKYIDYGMQIYSKEILDLIPGNKFIDLAQIYQVLILQRNLSAYEANTPFYDIGTKQDIARVARYLDTIPERDDKKIAETRR